MSRTRKTVVKHQQLTPNTNDLRIWKPGFKDADEAAQELYFPKPEPLAPVKDKLTIPLPEGVHPSSTEARRIRQRRFLEVFAQTGVEGYSVSLVGTSLHMLAVWRKDPEFEKAFQEARDMARDVLVQEARRRAVDGDIKVRRTFDRNGNVVAEEEEVVRDNKLLVYLLDRYWPNENAATEGRDRMQIQINIVEPKQKTLPQPEIAEGEFHPVTE